MYSVAHALKEGTEAATRGCQDHNSDMHVTVANYPDALTGNGQHPELPDTRKVDVLWYK